MPTDTVTLLRCAADHCAACSRDLLPAQVSGSTWTRRPLCESCAMLLDGLRFAPDGLTIFPERRVFPLPRGGRR